MKKTGFTLAEVLITLAIIGVVATMTLPALMTNTAEQQSKTGLKKVLNTLNLAASMNQANKGFDYSSITVESKVGNGDDDMSIFRILNDNAQVDMSLTTDDAKLKIKGGGAGNETPNTNFTVFFRDGSAISFPKAGNPYGTGGRTIADDGLPYGIPVLVDINGNKNPNILSNCESKATDATAEDKHESTDCNRTNKVIKDQFSVRLRGTVVQPNGAAARWAIEN